MNALTKTEPTAITRMSEPELLKVLGDSLYPGATEGSIRMVLSYCKAAGLDPLQKPVHIVPMSVKKPGTRDQYEWRDVIMPGVGLYRTQAARTERFAGQSEPEFGPMVTEKLGGMEVTYPEWCKVSVRKLMQNGSVATFTATEFWIENYATAGRDSQKPNAMWAKRPRGQLAKCASAQALRLAFPEMGAQPTAEEMEGKTMGDENLEPQAPAGKPEVATPQRKPKPQAQHQTAAQQADGDGVIDVEPRQPQDGPQDGQQQEEGAGQQQEGEGSQAAATEGEKAHILQQCNRKKVTVSDARVGAGLEAADSLNDLTTDGFVAMKDYLRGLK